MEMGKDRPMNAFGASVEQPRFGGGPFSFRKISCQEAVRRQDDISLRFAAVASGRRVEGQSLEPRDLLAVDRLVLEAFDEAFRQQEIGRHGGTVAILLRHLFETEPSDVEMVLRSLQLSLMRADHRARKMGIGRAVRSEEQKDRKRVVKGQSGSVGVSPGVPRILKKKNNDSKTKTKYK